MFDETIGHQTTNKIAGFFSPTMTWHVVEIVVSTPSTTIMCLESVSWLLLIK
jgi:hypothetical protein